MCKVHIGDSFEVETDRTSVVFTVKQIYGSRVYFNVVESSYNHDVVNRKYEKMPYIMRDEIIESESINKTNLQSQVNH